jgi:hypothetical protein
MDSLPWAGVIGLLAAMGASALATHYTRRGV